MFEKIQKIQKLVQTPDHVSDVKLSVEGNLFVLAANDTMIKAPLLHKDEMELVMTYYAHRLTENDNDIDVTTLVNGDGWIRILSAGEQQRHDALVSALMFKGYVLSHKLED